MTLIQSHNYTINLDKVSYFTSHQRVKNGKPGTLFTFHMDRQVFITCPYDVVVKHIKMVQHHYERIGSSTGSSPAIKVIKLKY